jgi:hypothetical protein
VIFTVSTLARATPLRYLCVVSMLAGYSLDK